MAKQVSDSKLLEQLLVHGGVSGAASALGISRNAIYKRLQNAQFRAQFDAAQGAVISAAATCMSAALEVAVGALLDVLHDKSAAPSVKVQAANCLLTHCNRYVEADNVLRRLDALEAQNETNS